MEINMEFTLITVGLLFLMNPLVAIADVLPDFIGCILILLGINRLRAVSPELDDAVPPIKYMIYVSIARTVIFFGSGGFDDITLLSITVMFAVIEFGLGSAMLSALHGGLAYLNIRYDGSTKESPEMRNVGVVFLAVKGVLSVVPLLGAIASDSENILEDVTEGWAAFSGLLTVSNVVITLIFAAFWGFSVLGYIGKMAKDGAFRSKIQAAYELKREQNPNFFMRRTLLFAFAFLSVSSFFFIDFLGDGKNYIPDFLFALTSLFGIYVLSSKTEVKKEVYISGGIYFVLSLADYIYYMSFMERRFFASFRIIRERFLWEYILLIVLAALSSAALIVYFKYLYRMLNTVIDTHAVHELSDEYVRSNRLNRELIVKYRRLNKAFTVLGIVTAASHVAFSVLIVIVPEYWMLNLAISIAVFCLSINLFSRLKEGVIAKYELESDAG